MAQEKMLGFFVALAMLLAMGAITFIASVLLLDPPFAGEEEHLTWRQKDNLFIARVPAAWQVEQFLEQDKTTISIRVTDEGDPRRNVAIELFSVIPDTHWEGVSSTFLNAYLNQKSIDASILESCGTKTWGLLFDCYRSKDGSTVPGLSLYISALRPDVIAVVHYDEADGEVELNFVPTESELKNSLLIQ